MTRTIHTITYFIIPHILITINRLIWLDNGKKSQHVITQDNKKIIFREINIIFHLFGSLAGFPARVTVLWQENVRGTRTASLASDRYNVVDVVFKCLRQRSNGLEICLPAVFYMYVFCVFLVSFGIIKHL